MIFFNKKNTAKIMFGYAGKNPSIITQMKINSEREKMVMMWRNTIQQFCLLSYAKLVPIIIIALAASSYIA